jgi:glycosyltransferase involved in cell wall biosynthesis
VKTSSPTAPEIDSPLRLAVDGRTLSDEYHGIGRLTEMVLRRLAQDQDFQVTVFLRRAQRSRRFDISGLTEGLGHQRAVFDLPLTSPLQWVRWPGALRRAGAQVTLSPYSLGAPLVGGGRKCTFVHDCIIETDTRFAPDRRTRWLYMAHTAMIMRLSLVLTQSVASALDIQRFYGVPVADQEVIMGGIDADFADGASRIDRIGEITLPQHYILQVGARRPHKNVAALVRCLPYLPENYHLVLVGSIDRRFADPVPQLAHKLGVNHRILHFASVSETELQSLYAGAAVFTYPSLIEGLGLPLLEAMAAGIPVVASDIPVFQEVAGDAATLVDPDDSTAWAEAVLALQDPDRRQRLIRAGRHQVQKATWDVSMSRLVDALRKKRA